MSHPRDFRAPRLAILGAGPTGLEAALEGAARGFDVQVYEADRVAESLRRFEWVRLFTPFEMNSTARGRARLEAVGRTLPRPDAFLTAGELVAQYLEPLARLPELADRVHEHARVSGVAREGVFKSGGIVATGNGSRIGRPFVIRVETPDGARTETADVVLDATGVYRSPRATGAWGLPALGEEALGDAIDRHLTPIAGAASSRFAGRRVLLIGAGYSAATALVEFEALASRGSAAQVTWIRNARPGAPFQAASDDPLVERVRLAANANRIAGSASWLVDAVGARVERYERAGDAWRVTLRGADDSSRAVDVDRVLALVGYQPDASIHRELQIHLCYASEGPMALASAVLAAALADPAAGGDCLKQVSHGPDTLKNPEPDFYLIGAKSYGRNPHYFLALGHQQVLDVMGLVEAERTPAPAPSVGSATR